MSLAGTQPRSFYLERATPSARLKFIHREPARHTGDNTRLYSTQRDPEEADKATEGRSDTQAAISSLRISKNTLMN